MDYEATRRSGPEAYWRYVEDPRRRRQRSKARKTAQHSVGVATPATMDQEPLVGMSCNQRFQKRIYLARILVNELLDIPFSFNVDRFTIHDGVSQEAFPLQVYRNDR